MPEDEKLTRQEWHKKMAVELFNHTWDLIDKGDKRTPDENDEMIHAAHASRYHWGVVVDERTPNTGPTNLERGDWQISRVYALLKRPQAALYHAERCLSICQKHNIGDFDIAFAYEAMARAYAILGGKPAEVKRYLGLAKKAAENIAKEDDKKYFLSELKTIAGYQG
jgi:hypothetical protein